MFMDLRERERERQRERERDVRVPGQGLNLQPFGVWDEAPPN